MEEREPEEDETYDGSSISEKQQDIENGNKSTLVNQLGAPVESERKDTTSSATEESEAQSA